jgi:Flp pilus assembly protein TadB
MESKKRPPLTDSPWFYVLVFSAMALFALLVIGPKYGQRQSRLERNYQARERVTERSSVSNKEDADTRKDQVAARRDYATPGNTLVPLWPLAMILGIITLFAGFMLRRAMRTPVSPVGNGGMS